MAENDTDVTEPPTETPVAKLAKTQFLLIVGLVAVTQVGVSLVMERTRPANPPLTTVTEDALAEDALAEEAFVAEPEIDVQDLAGANYLPLDPALVVNLKNDGDSRYLQASVQLMTRDEAVFGAARLHSPAIRSALIMLLGTIEYESVATRQGKEALQDEARLVADEVLMDLAGVQGIDAVYLTSFVIQ